MKPCPAHPSGHIQEANGQAGHVVNSLMRPLLDNREDFKATYTTHYLLSYPQS